MATALSLRNVLFTTDFSDASRPAGRIAADIARHFGARLHVLHVVPPITDPTPAPAGLRAAAAELDAGSPVVTAVASGRPASEIVKYARRNVIELIVLGTHGRTGVSRALLGSVADAVTRRAGCPVLTVPAVSTRARGAAALDDEVQETTSCVVCGGPSQGDLICEPCRAKIRGEALERKRAEERPGRR